MKKVSYLFFLFFSISFSLNKTYVFDVDFSGNVNIQDSDLEKLLRLKKKTFLSTSEFKVNKLNLDILSLKSFYQSNGYLDVQIDYDYAYIDDHNVSIEFFVLEGPQYKIRNFILIGNKSFKDSYILDLIKLPSDYYNPTYIRNKLIDIKNEYLRVGKVNVSIINELIKEDSYVDLRINISEGNKFFINNVNVTGLNNIDRKLVDRELVFKIGDFYNIDKINESKKYLFESQLFSSVEIFPYVETDSTISLNVRVRELISKEIELEAGFSQLPSNKGDLPVSAINGLGRWHKSNILNTATKVSLVSEYGFSYSKSNKFLRAYYELGFYSPWFIKTRIPFRLKIYSENILINTFKVDDARLGIITYVENYRSSNPNLSFGLITEFFQSKNLNNQNRTIYTSYVKHNINNFIHPNNGYYISISPRLNGTFLGGSYHYLKNDIEIKLFKNIIKNVIFASRCKIGTIYEIEYFNSRNDVPEFDKFFLGGSSSLRGWLSPLEYNNEDGQYFRILINQELRIPVYKILGIEIFYDGGVLGYNNLKDNYHWNIGWGITILSGLGPARIDFAFPFGAGKSTIQVSLLNMF